MCHHHIEDREWTVEENEWTIEAEERGEEMPDPADEPSFIEPGDPDVSLDRDYESSTSDD